MDTFQTKVQQYNDTQDLFIEIPHYILQNLDWEEGDELAWSIKTNQIILTKVKDTTEPKEEPTMSDYDYYESQSEGKEFDDIYDDYIEASIEETSSLEGYEFTQD